MRVLNFPLSIISLCFVGGIFFGNYFCFNLSYVLFGLLSLVCTLCIFTLYNRKRITAHYYFEINTIFIAFLLGIFSITKAREIHDSSHFIHFISKTEKRHTLEIVIKEKLKSNLFNNRWLARVKKLDGKPSLGKIIFNLKKEDFKASCIGIGSIIKTSCTIQKNKDNSSIGQFNYFQYLKNQSIYAQIYPDVHDVKISSFKVKDLNYYATAFRNKIIKNLKKSGFHDKELHVIIALLLGQQQEISKDILQNYRYAGAVHILSVSGLHVGLLMGFISFLLGVFPSSKNGNRLKLILIIASLWLFAIVAGLAPCVVRSVTMFSFLAIGKHLNRASNIYYTLLISMLLILFFEPTFLFDVGFQLSYIALFFIVWLQPFFSSFWQPKNKIVTYFWDIITISFAAQIGSFPIITYHFHQFPGLFFITNLIILPFLSSIMLLGLVVLVMAFFDCIWIPMMHLLEKSIQILNQTIGWIASFEDFVFKDISFSLSVMLASYLTIILWLLWMKNSIFNKLIFSLLAIILLQFTFIFTKYRSQSTSEFVVFNEKKACLFIERIGTNVAVFTTKNQLNTIQNNPNLKAYLVENSCRITAKKVLSNFHFFKNQKIMLIDSSSVYLKNKETTILLLSDSPKINLDRVLHYLQPKVIVADGSNYKKVVSLWKETCSKQKIPFYDTRELGCFVLK
jgi:competence protein ComEC